MNHDEELDRYEDEAEDRHDDYDEEYEDEFYDDEEDEFDTGLEGHEEDEFYEDEDDYEEEIEYLPAMEDDYDSYDDDFDSYKSASIGMIDPNDRTLTVVVKNASGGDAEAIVFGGNEGAASPAGVDIVVEESSHKEVREESKANPFKIAGMKMSVSNPLQFDNVLKVTRRTATGSNTVRVYQPRNATSPQNFTQQLIDDAAFEMDVTGQDSLRLFVKDGVTVVFTFTIKARANMGNLLKGNNVAELSKAPRTTGLPQLDLMQRKKKRKRPVRPVRAVRRILRKRPKARRVLKTVTRPHRKVASALKRRGRRLLRRRR